MLLGALGVSIVLFNVPYGGYVLYPFKIFATWVHETGHGLAALLCGGELRHILIRADTSGLAVHATSTGVLTRAFVTSAGYLGTSVFGALLLWLGTASERRARFVLAGVGAAMLVVDALFVRNLFGLIAVGAIGAVLVVVARKAGPTFASGLLHLLAAQSCINAVLDIRVLFSAGSGVVPGQGRSDAAAMQDLLLLPYWFWASLWLVVSVLLLSFALWRAFRRQDRRTAGAPPGTAAKATPVRSS